MNKNAIQKYAIWARNELIEQVKQRAYQYGIDEKSYGEESATVISGRVLSAGEKQQRQSFVREIQQNGYQQAVEEVAYTWFNRFVALRFMEVNDYLPTHVRVFSDANGGFNPEILKDVLHLDLDGLDKAKVSELLNANKTEELYRYLLLTQCNALNAALPEMFEKLGGYTEMLLPNNILKQDSVLARLVKNIPEEDWEDAVQIIGWMYQYYNTEPKQAVFDGLKKNQKITKEKIPAATQLFTPDWIVRYMVENSLGRLWLEHLDPNSSGLDYPYDYPYDYANPKVIELKRKWKYYLEEAPQEPEVKEQLKALRAKRKDMKPEDIRVIDPCMGSGHILVYAFDVLMQIYESVGTSPRDAAKLILEDNLFGLDIDRRAYQLAYFALMMKARQHNRRILSGNVKPHLNSFISSAGASARHFDFMGEGFTPLEDKLCRESLEYLMGLFADAQEYGSLIKIERDLDYPLLRRFIAAQKGGQITLGDDMSGYADFSQTEQVLLQILDIAETLARKYDIVVTNPPYMGSGSMSSKLSDFVKKNYPDSKNDLFAVFIERCGELLKPSGLQAMITQHAWMFLSGFEALRKKLVHRDIVNMAHLGANAFEEIRGEIVQTTAFVLSKHRVGSYKALYIRLVEYGNQQTKEDAFLSSQNRYNAKKESFEKIPGCPISYWLSETALDAYSHSLIKDVAAPRAGLATGDNTIFQRLWQEIEYPKIGFDYSDVSETKSGLHKWFPCDSGGAYRKWATNNEYVVDWENNGQALRSLRNAAGKLAARPQNTQYYFKQGLTWNKLSTTRFAVKYKEKGSIYDDTSRSAFPNNEDELYYLIGLMCSCVSIGYLMALNPTMSFSNADIKRIPFVFEKDEQTAVDELVSENILLSRTDWDSFETSWDFKRQPLICGEQTVAAAFVQWEREASERFDTLKSNEEELNRIFIDIYGLQDELTPEVEEKDVTVRRADLQREIRSLISYAVGCMFGRYSLDTDGLAYAGGEWDASKYRSFTPDKDNILPICDDEYFDDDIVGLFTRFIKTVYGADTLEENLKFIADALGGKGTPREVIRNYFLHGFYADHCKIYQKRPIYWLFDSGKKHGFKALVYLHRYSRDLLAKLRTDYVHEQQERYRTQLNHIGTALNNATGAERAKLLKQQDKLTEQAKEISTYEEKVHHLADQNITIDLDNGVKKNYEIFADVLAKI
jgi:hypothetical protein